MQDRKRKRIFEENYEEINRVVTSKRNKWNLKAIPWMSFEDVKQLIFLHIYEKLHLWDEEKGKIGPWVNVIAHNRIKNILRDNYYNYARPCLGCEFNSSKKGGKFVLNSEENGCTLTKSGIQCEECPMYAKWIRSKKQAYNIKLPVPIETQEIPIENRNTTYIDYEASENLLHKKMRRSLTIKDYKCYDLLFIQKLPEKIVAEKLGYITNEKNRPAGYNTIKKLKKNFLIKAKKIMEDEDIII